MARATDPTEDSSKATRARGGVFAGVLAGRPAVASPARSTERESDSRCVQGGREEFPGNSEDSVFPDTL